MVWQDINHRRVNILEEFWKRAVNEKLSGTIFVGIVLVLSAVCLFAEISIPAFHLTLPQVKLGFAFLIIGAAFIAVSFVAFKRSLRPVTNTETPITDSDLFMIPAIQPEKPTVRILISGDGDGMIFWKMNDAGELRAWLDVVNFTSDPVKIDRVIGDITVSSVTVAQLNHFKKQTVAAASADRVYVHAELSPQHIKAIEFQLQHQSEPSAGLNLTVYLITEKGEQEFHPHLNTGNCRFKNFAPKKAI